jgi:hypothetical protein
VDCPLCGGKNAGNYACRSDGARIARWRQQVYEFSRYTGYFEAARLQTLLPKLHPVFAWYLLLLAVWHKLWIDGQW